MKLADLPYVVTNWEDKEKVEVKGETGISLMRTFEEGDLRVRVVEYSPGYMADHWCPRGHVLYVLEGLLVNELQDGTKSILKKGTGFIVGDNEKNQHRVYTEDGAVVFIVD